MLFASYTDVMPLATDRASLFFITTSMQYFAQTFCPPIGAWLMNLDGKGGTPQVNLFVSLGLAILVALIAIFIFPETVLESRKKEPIDNGRVHPASAQPVAATLMGENHEVTAPPSKIRKLLNDFSETVSGVGVINILLLSLSICFAATGIKAIDWYALIQYPVIKLHWTFSQASTVVSLQGFLMLVHFCIILPTINRAAAAWLGAATAHFAIMVGSSLLLTLGSLFIGFSSTPTTFVTGVVVYLLGEGLPPATQAYIVSLVDKSKVARVMATLSMASIFGKLTASVLFPYLLALGLDTHVDVLVGLPLFVSAGLFVVSALCVGIVGLRMRIAYKEGR
jgi:MFS family permease